MNTVNGQPGIDFLILADRAEAINGKLYMMGGGWDRLNLSDLTQPAPISLAVGILIPWGQTNTDHRLDIWLEHEDGTQVKPQINAVVNSGRPPHSVKGQQFRTMIAINGAWSFPAAGTYRFMARLGDAPVKSYVFHVLPVAQPKPVAQSG